MSTEFILKPHDARDYKQTFGVILAMVRAPNSDGCMTTNASDVDDLKSKLHHHGLSILRVDADNVYVDVNADGYNVPRVLYYNYVCTDCNGPLSENRALCCFCDNDELCRKCGNCSYCGCGESRDRAIFENKLCQS